MISQGTVGGECPARSSAINKPLAKIMSIGNGTASGSAIPGNDVMTDALVL